MDRGGYTSGSSLEHYCTNQPQCAKESTGIESTRTENLGGFEMETRSFIMAGLRRREDEAIMRIGIWQRDRDGEGARMKGNPLLVS